MRAPLTTALPVTLFLSSLLFWDSAIGRYHHVEMVSAPFGNVQGFIMDHTKEEVLRRPEPLSQAQRGLQLSQLDGTCWNAEDGLMQTRMTVCLFDNITRTSLRTFEKHPEVLGVFEHWEKRDLLFSDGDFCGGDRNSAVVELSCPRKETRNITEVIDIEKLSFCETKFKLQSPLACELAESDELQQCRDELAELREAVFAKLFLPEVLRVF